MTGLPTSPGDATARSVTTSLPVAVSLWLVLAVLATSVVLTAQDPERARTEAQARRVDDRIRALQSEADRLAGEARTLLGELRALEVEQQLQTERVSEAQAALERGRAAVDEATARLDGLERQRLAQLPDLEAQLVDIYKRGRTGYAKLLFGTTSAREFGRALRAVAALMHINEGRVAEHRRTLDELRRQRAALEEELRAIESRDAEARRVRAAADRALAARARLLAQLDSRRDLTAQLAGELQLAHDRLQQQVTALSAGRPVEPVAVPVAPFRGALEWPVSGQVLVPFGSTSGRPGDSAGRNGIEIAAPAGTPVHAVHPGTISYAEPFGGFGNLVIVDHGANTYTVYGYLDTITMASGTPVDAGAELGRVGSVGGSR